MLAEATVRGFQIRARRQRKGFRRVSNPTGAKNARCQRRERPNSRTQNWQKGLSLIEQGPS